MYYEDDGNKFEEGKTYRKIQELFHNYDEDGKNFGKNLVYDENDKNNFGKSTTYEKEKHYDDDRKNMTYGEKMYYMYYGDDKNDKNNLGRNMTSGKYYDENDENNDDDDDGERRGTYYYYDDDDDDGSKFGERKGTYYDDEEDDDDDGSEFGEGKEMYYDDEEDDDEFSRREEMYYDDDEEEEDDDESKFGKGKGTYYDDYDDDDNGDNFGKSTTYRRRKMHYDYDENFEENTNYLEYDGNKFGERIPYRKGKGIQLVKYENEKIILIKESLEIIQKIEEPVAIISVVGSYRRGKSYFANVLHGRHDGFELGSKVDSCTKGIFMWDTPFFHNGCRVIVLDCEGIDDPKQDEVWAMKLFILCLAISSTFVYNINGIVGRDDIGKLYTMTDLSKFLLKSEDDERDYLPRLAVLLRDFGLEDPDNFKDYFLERLAQVDSDAAAGINNYFKDFDVYALPHPGCNKRVLRELEKIETSQLDPDFTSQMSHTVSEIYDTISPKKINSKSMTGTSFSQFLQDCIQHMNATNTLNKISLSTQYTSLINFMSRLAIDVGFTYYSDTMTTKSIHDFPLSWDAFEDVHAMTLSMADFLFSEKLIGSYSQTLDTRTEFETRIADEKRIFTEKNSETLKNYNLNLANSLWLVHVKPGLTADQLFKNHGEFDNALETFMEKYTNQSFDGQEAMEVYEQFKDQETESALETLDRMFKLRDVINSTKDTHQELINHIKQSEERLNQLLDENDREGREHKELIDELVSAIDNLYLNHPDLKTYKNS